MDQDGLSPQTGPSRLSTSQVVQDLLRTATHTGMGVPTSGLSAVDTMASSMLGALSGLPRTMVVEAIEFPATEEGYVSQVSVGMITPQDVRRTNRCFHLLTLHVWQILGLPYAYHTMIGMRQNTDDLGVPEIVFAQMKGAIFFATVLFWFVVNVSYCVFPMEPHKTCWHSTHTFISSAILNFAFLVEHPVCAHW